MSAEPSFPFQFPSSAGASPPPTGSEPLTPLPSAPSSESADELAAGHSAPGAPWATGAPSASSVAPPAAFPSVNSPAPLPPAPTFPPAPAFGPAAPAASFPAPSAGFRRQSGNVFLGLLLIGGGALILVSLAVVAGMGWAFSGRVGDDLWRQQMILTIEESDIPRSEKSELISHVNRLAAACDSGQISRDQLRKILARLEESPVFVAMDLGGIEQEIVVQSGLSVEERQAARSTLVRALRGVFAGKISIDDFYGALPPGYYVRAELTAFLSQKELDEFFAQFDDEPFQQATDEQVRQSLARLDELATKVGIRSDIWTIDISDELAKAIKEARKEAGVAGKDTEDRGQRTDGSKKH